MRAWVPEHNHLPELATDTTERYRSIAADITTASLGAQPLFGDDEMHVKSATLLAAVASYEGGFAAYVDNGSCNKTSWRTANPKMPGCDGGNAFSLWQIHPGVGIRLDEKVGYGFLNTFSYDPKGWSGWDLIKDRKRAVWVASAMLHVSLRASGTLCGYTGERGPHCPKAVARLGRAKTWVADHPYKVTDFGAFTSEPTSSDPVCAP
jgi:hypothetical protein